MAFLFEFLEFDPLIVSQNPACLALKLPITSKVFYSIDVMGFEIIKSEGKMTETPIMNLNESKNETDL